MNPRNDKIWFPAKTHGYGWGPPVCWQGWVMMGAFFVLLGLGISLLPPDKHRGACLAYTGVLLAGLIGICRWKGEKPQWRWGPPKAKRDDHS